MLLTARATRAARCARSALLMMVCMMGSREGVSMEPKARARTKARTKARPATDWRKRSARPIVSWLRARGDRCARRLLNASKAGFVACGIKRMNQICGRRSEGTHLAAEGAIGGNDRPGRRGPPYKARGFQGAADSHPCIGATGYWLRLACLWYFGHDLTLVVGPDVGGWA